VGIEFVCRHLTLKKGSQVSGPHHMSSGQWYRNSCRGCAGCSEGPEQSKIKCDIIESSYRERWH
jgi:hypothetical protein